VSLDGSWNTRGWSAHDGVIAAVSIDTGKVLDVQYLTNSCPGCSAKEYQLKEETISKREFLKWYIEHEPNCYLNHDGSSQVCLQKIFII